MTVKDAIQSIVSLSGVLDACSCTNNGVLEAAVTSLNRAMQEIWTSPTNAFQSREEITVTVPLPSSTPDLPASVQTVVGPMTWGAGRAPVLLCATRSEFTNFFRSYGAPAAEPLVDVFEFLNSHDPGGGNPYWGTEFLLPLSDGKALLVYFDNTTAAHTVQPQTGKSPAGFDISPDWIFVRVALADTLQTAQQCTTAVLTALKIAAGRWLTVERDPSSLLKLNISRRRACDIDSWLFKGTRGGTVTPGYRRPVVAWVEERKSGSGPDLARARLHLAPPAAGYVRVEVIKHPIAYTVEDIDCANGGFNSADIAIAHQYAASLLLPLARVSFAQDYPALLADKTVALIESLNAAAMTARQTLGLASPNASLRTQRNQSPADAHA